ncbi:MAG: hypothetical protein AAF571_01730 [Verrucomicrobiota bacterium]
MNQNQMKIEPLRFSGMETHSCPQLLEHRSDYLVSNKKPPSVRLRLQKLTGQVK